MRNVRKFRAIIRLRHPTPSRDRKYRSLLRRLRGVAEERGVRHEAGEKVKTLEYGKKKKKERKKHEIFSYKNNFLYFSIFYSSFFRILMF